MKYDAAALKTLSEPRSVAFGEDPQKIIALGDAARAALAKIESGEWIGPVDLELTYSAKPTAVRSVKR